MSSLAISQNENKIPKPIVDKLRSVVRRARIVMLVRGVLIVCAVALAALLLGMAIDSAVLIFSSAVRMSISLSLLACVLVAAWVFLVRPLSRSFDLTGIARIIEQRHPELEERISSAVQLLSSSDAEEIRGSETLIGELAKQAVGQVSSVSPQKEYSFAAARPAFIAALIAAAILAAIFMVWPSTAGRLFHRVVAPLANIGNVQSEDIVVEPGDVVVAAGESLKIDVKVMDRRVRSARLRTRNGEEVEAGIRMKRVENREDEEPLFALSMPTVSNSFEYRVSAGGALSRYYKVNVVERPAVEQFKLTFQFPEYLQRENVVVTNRSPNIHAPIGTVVTIVAQTKTRFASAQLKIDGLSAIDGAIQQGGDAEPDLTSGRGCRWQVELTDQFVIGRSWQVLLEDEHGFTNDPALQTIVAIPDNPPTITIVEPAELLQRRSISDTLPLQYRVEEDFGVSSVEMIVATDGGKELSQSLVIPTRVDAGLLTGNASYNSLTQLELSKLAMPNSKEVRIHLRVRDLLPDGKGGPQVANSETLTIIFDKNADSYFEETAAADYAGIRDALQRVLSNLQQADDRTSVLTNDVKPIGKLSEKVNKRIDEIRELTDDSFVELIQLADVLPTTSFAPLQFEVGDLMASDVSSAREQAGLIKLADTPLERGLYAEASDKHTERAIERTEGLIGNLDKLWAQIQEIANLRELAARQERVADEIAETSEQQLSKIDEMTVAKEQDELAKEVADLLKIAPDAYRELLLEKEEEAEELHEKADRVAARQERLAQLTAESNHKHADPEKMQDRLLDHVERQQREIAEAVARLDQEIEDAQRAGDDEKSDLREEPREAVEKIKKVSFAEAAEKAEEAATNLKQAADALKGHHDVPKKENANTDQRQDPNAASVVDSSDPKTDTKDPNDEDSKNNQATKTLANDDDNHENDSDEGEQSKDGKDQLIEPGKPKPQDERLAEKAAELGARQKSVAQQIDALREGNLDEAMKLMQEQASKETDGIVRQADEITDLLRILELPKWTLQHGDRAERELAKAQQFNEQSVKQLDNATQEAEQFAKESVNASKPSKSKPMKKAEKNDKENSAQSPTEESDGQQPDEVNEPFTARESESKRQATETQHQSAQALRQAAAILRQVAQTIHTEANNIKPETIAELMTAEAIGEELAQAADATAETTTAIEATADAASSEATTSQADAEQAARRAAQALARAADKAAQKAGLMSQASQTGKASQAGENGEQSDEAQTSQQGDESGEEGENGQKGKSNQTTKSDEPGDGEKGRLDGTLDNNLQQKLDEIGISATQWTRLPGSLKSRLRQSKTESVPEEYRGMVRRYFREIARRSDSTEAISNGGANE